MEKDQHAPPAEGVAGPLKGGQALPGMMPHEAMLAAMGGRPPSVRHDADTRLQFEREQDYFNDLYLLAPVGYFVLAADTTVLQMNLVGADLLGLPRHNPERVPFRHYIAQRFMADFEAFVHNALH